MCEQVKDMRESLSEEEGDEATGGLKRGSGDKKRKGDVSTPPTYATHNARTSDTGLNLSKYVSFS